MNDSHNKNTNEKSIFSILKPYKGLIAGLVILIFLMNGLGLLIPKLISHGIDAYGLGTLAMKPLVIEFLVISLFILLLTYLQGVLQAYTAEKAASELRSSLVNKISGMSFARLELETPSKLLTNLTSDIDAVKMFVSMAIPNIISSISVIIGAAGLIIFINWKLALAVLAILPMIGLVFALVFSRVGPLFKKGQEIIDRMNGTISENIVAAALVRVINAGKFELGKFSLQNAEVRENGMNILKLFSIIIPTVGIIANLASLIILALGGKFVIGGSMTIGDFTAFNSYVFMLIFPIIMLGFISNIISRAQASYVRIREVLTLVDDKDAGTETGNIKGNIEVRGVTLMYGEKAALKDVSFKVQSGSKTAIVGPTAAGKTQLLYTLIGLIKPVGGEVLYDGKPLESYQKKTLHDQVAIVFQDSVMFNLSLRENIAFNPKAKDEDVKKAIEAAELSEFVGSLPQGLDTVVSERGTSLSGGQKQRVMLARALALNPRVLLLDDFTARVDTATEEKILGNIEKMYPGMTIVSVTQKVRSAEAFDQTVLIMEGEVLAIGTHAQLAETSPEYAQIIESQKSTQTYE